MKTLPAIVPTAEQLPIISDNRLGVEVIRGAAGSGKTSTAILRLRSLAYWLEARRERLGASGPLKIIVLTFNRTLRGYVHRLVHDQVTGLNNSEVEIDTFARWAMGHLGHPNIVDHNERSRLLKRLSSGIDSLSKDYVAKEVDYVLGRFPHDRLEDYAVAERSGRGSQPLVTRAIQRRILDDVVRPYQAQLDADELWDWNEVAVAMCRVPKIGYDIAIIDESQDFSANELRAVRAHLNDEYAITFVIDAVQKLYARGFKWGEIDFDMRGANYRRLKVNHRNTTEIAAFTSGILDKIQIDDDGTLPDLTAAKSRGEKPKLVRGIYSKQVSWSIETIREDIDLKSETVAFLKPEVAYFPTLRGSLSRAGFKYVDITRERDWPTGSENIALSTFHSAKGLEFDHVFILGLSSINTNHAGLESDDQLLVLRRLLAVAVARARKTVTVGFKPGEESALNDFFKAGTFDEVDL